MAVQNAITVNMSAAKRILRLSREIDNMQLLFGDCHMILLSNIYLVGSYMYYYTEDQLMSDRAHDALSRYMLKHWDDMVEEGVWHLGTAIHKGDLASGSALDAEYSTTIKNIAYIIIHHIPST